MITVFGLSLEPNGGKTWRLQCIQFLPVTTLVWKSPPLSLKEALRQHFRFESMFHVVIPWVFRWGGTKGVAKLWMKHYIAGSGMAFTVILVFLAWCLDKKTTDVVFPMSNHCLQLLAFTFILPIICWPQLERALTIQAKKLGIAQDVMIPHPEGSLKIFKTSLFGLILTPLPIFVIM